MINNNRRMFDYLYNKIFTEDKECYLSDLIIRYIKYTVLDILNDYDVEISKQELQDLCYKVFDAGLFSELDDMIYKCVVKEKQLTNE
jgi:hypothetical protein